MTRRNCGCDAEMHRLRGGTGMGGQRDGETEGGTEGEDRVMCCGHVTMGLLYRSIEWNVDDCFCRLH